MLRIECPYCGKYFYETIKYCPHCGRINERYKEIQCETPKTIRKLKRWHTMYGIPPEKTLKLFIGANVSDRGAFGVYKENNNFIFYENSKTGQRITHYQGENESFAVEQLYEKFTQEMLRREKILNKKDDITPEYHDDRPQGYNGVLIGRKKHFNKYIRTPKGQKKVIIFLAIIFMMPSIFLAFSAITDYVESAFSNEIEVSNYYYSEDEVLYYNAKNSTNKKNSDWWIYDKETNKWSLFKFNQTTQFAPNGIQRKHLVKDISKLSNKINEPYDDTNIKNSEEFKNVRGHQEPEEGYYLYDGKIYYFLYDNAGMILGVNTTAWYTYENNQWVFMCQWNDFLTLPDDLKNSAEEYFISKEYKVISSYDASKVDVIPSDFLQTQWNKTRIENQKEFERWT